MLSALASVFKIGDKESQMNEEDILKIMTQVKDPLGTFYRVHHAQVDHQEGRQGKGPKEEDGGEDMSPIIIDQTHKSESKRITIDPITRLEGHGKIEIFLNDEGNVANAYWQVPELRGFEKLLHRPFGRRAEQDHLPSLRRLPRSAPPVLDQGSG